MAKRRLYEKVRYIDEKNYFGCGFLFKLTLAEAYSYAVKRLFLENKKSLSICLICGRWFEADYPHHRVCSRTCRTYHNYIFRRLLKGGLRAITKRFRKSPLYAFLYLAVQKGYLPAMMLGEATPEDLPRPLFPLSNLASLHKYLDFSEWIKDEAKHEEVKRDAKEENGGDRHGE